MKRTAALLAIALGLVAALGSAPAPAKTQQGKLLVAAAADLRLAFTEMGAAFTRQTGNEVTFTFGSSGQLAQQIAQGAPYDLFASADISWVDTVIAAGEGDKTTKRLYAYGRLVLWSRKDKGLVVKRLSDLRKPEIRTVAIANPEHAPYGKAAKQALVAAGVYDEIKAKLVYGENIAATMQLAQTGNADVGIVALSLAITSTGTWKLVPTILHNPLAQTLVVTGQGGQAALAKRFIAFQASKAGRTIMRKYGFLLPGERPPSAPST